MKNKGVLPMVLGCCFLFWLFSSAPNKQPEPIPTDGLIEAVASVKESMQDPPQPSPSDRHEKAKREIIIFTRRNCPPCDRWKRCEQSKFEAEGWTVAYCDEHNYPLTPTFLIDANGKQTEHRGYLPFEKMKEVLK
jgi:hypothetical protein